MIGAVVLVVLRLTKQFGQRHGQLIPLSAQILENVVEPLRQLRIASRILIEVFADMEAQGVLHLGCFGLIRGEALHLGDEVWVGDRHRRNLGCNIEGDDVLVDQFADLLAVEGAVEVGQPGVAVAPLGSREIRPSRLASWTNGRASGAA